MEGEEYLKTLATAFVAAKKNVKEEIAMAITYPTPSETTCPLYGGARAKKGGGHVIQCGKWESPVSNDGDLLARIKKCEGPEKGSCRFYLIDWMERNGHKDEIVGLSDEAIRNIYDGYRLKEAQRTEIAPAEPVEVVVAPEPEKVEIQEVPPPGRTIADVTAEIRFYKAQTVQSVIEIGRRLIEAKGMLEHGQWLEWLEESIGISRRTAQRFMQLADTFPNASPVSHLSYTKLLALLAVPEEEREEFLEVTHNVGGEEKTVAEMSKRELEQVIRERDQYRELMHEHDVASKKYQEELKEKGKELDQALKEQERLKMLADASDKMAEIRQKKLEEKGQELYEAKNQAAAEKLRYERELHRLESRPVEVAIQPPSEEELERIREEAREEGRQEIWESSSRPAMAPATAGWRGYWRISRRNISKTPSRSACLF